MASSVDSEAAHTAYRPIDAFLKKSRAQLWIQHDLMANAALKKGPAFYD